MNVSNLELKSTITAKAVYFGNDLKHVLADELNNYFTNIIYPGDFRGYIDEEPLLSLPDIIFIEVDNNPDCFDQVRYIKNHPFLEGLIVILLGIKENQEWRKKALELKVSDYYFYPFPIENLQDRINFLVKIKLIKPKVASLAKRYAYEFKIPVLKRCFDIFVSASVLILLSPLLLLIALLVKLESKGPIIYKSKRVGSGYKIFDFYKFRSMRSDADKMLEQLKYLNQYADGEQSSAFVKFKNDPRITRIGKFIRKTSIDELPQLINVLLGDMSIVGNRPLPLYEAELLTTDQWATRFNGPAGLTGLWQISKRGKGEMSDQERKELDNFYASNYSLLLDLKIIIKTFPALIQKEQV